MGPAVRVEKLKQNLLRRKVDVIMMLRRVMAGKTLSQCNKKEGKLTSSVWRK